MLKYSVDQMEIENALKTKFEQMNIIGLVDQAIQVNYSPKHILCKKSIFLEIILEQLVSLTFTL